MREVAASYGFSIVPVSEGHRVTYQRLPLPTKVFVIGGMFGLVMAAVTALFFWLFVPCGGILLILFFGIVPLRLWIMHRRRVASPTTFMITPSQVVVGESGYDRAHIARFFVRDPATNGEVVYTQGGGGGFYVGGAGAAGVGVAAGMSALNSASEGMRQLSQAAADSAANSVKAVSVSIGFAYGEKTHTLATGLSAPRARLLLDAVVNLINAPATSSSS